jgi:hypothetical protein
MFQSLQLRRDRTRLTGLGAEGPAGTPARVRRNHLDTGRNHFGRETQSARSESPGNIVAIGQRGGFDHVDTYQFALSGILPRTLA